MSMFQRVTVALSMTEADADVLRYAARVAKLGVSTEFCFVHVVTPMQKPVMGADAVALRKQLESAVQEHFGQPVEGLKITSEVREGIRVDTLIEFVMEHESDLILLGHRKNRSGQRSLARRLAMITPCSVWMVPEGSAPQISRILAPVDFSEHSADSLSQAAMIARLTGLQECLALHVFFDDSTIRYDEHLDEVRGNELAKFEEFQIGVNTHGVALEPLFDESPNVAKAILRCAEKYSADLIVMSTRGRSRAAAILLGSATAQTMVESKIPVLAVKHSGARMSLFQALKASHFWDRPNPKTN